MPWYVEGTLNNTKQDEKEQMPLVSQHLLRPSRRYRLGRLPLSNKSPRAHDFYVKSAMISQNGQFEVSVRDDNSEVIYTSLKACKILVNGQVREMSANSSISLQSGDEVAFLRTSHHYFRVHYVPISLDIEDQKLNEDVSSTSGIMVHAPYTHHVADTITVSALPAVMRGNPVVSTGYLSALSQACKLPTRPSALSVDLGSDIVETLSDKELVEREEKWVAQFPEIGSDYTRFFGKSVAERDFNAFPDINSVNFSPKCPSNCPNIAQWQSNEARYTMFEGCLVVSFLEKHDAARTIVELGQGVFFAADCSSNSAERMYSDIGQLSPHRFSLILVQTMDGAKEDTVCKLASLLRKPKVCAMSSGDLEKVVYLADMSFLNDFKHFEPLTGINKPELIAPKAESEHEEDYRPIKKLSRRSGKKDTQGEANRLLSDLFSDSLADGSEGANPNETNALGPIPEEDFVVNNMSESPIEQHTAKKPRLHRRGGGAVSRGTFLETFLTQDDDGVTPKESCASNENVHVTPNVPDTVPPSVIERVPSTIGARAPSPVIGTSAVETGSALGSDGRSLFEKHLPPLEPKTKVKRDTIERTKPELKPGEILQIKSRKRVGAKAELDKRLDDDFNALGIAKPVMGHRRKPGTATKPRRIGWDEEDDSFNIHDTMYTDDIGNRPLISVRPIVLSDIRMRNVPNRADTSYDDVPNFKRFRPKSVGYTESLRIIHSSSYPRVALAPYRDASEKSNHKNVEEEVTFSDFEEENVSPESAFSRPVARSSPLHQSSSTVPRPRKSFLSDAQPAEETPGFDNDSMHEISRGNKNRRNRGKGQNTAELDDSDDDESLLNFKSFSKARRTRRAKIEVYQV